MGTETVVSMRGDRKQPCHEKSHKPLSDENLTIMPGDRDSRRIEHARGQKPTTETNHKKTRNNHRKQPPETLTKIVYPRIRKGSLSSR